MPAEWKTKKASAIHKPQGSQQEELKKYRKKICSAGYKCMYIPATIPRLKTEEKEREEEGEASVPSG